MKFVTVSQKLENTLQAALTQYRGSTNWLSYCTKEIN